MVCMKLNSQANLLNSSPLNGGPLSDITMVGYALSCEELSEMVDGLEMMCRCHWEDVFELAEVICND